MSYQKRTITKYIVELSTPDGFIVIGYNKKLDGMNMPTSLSQAIHSACRFNGKIFEEYSDETAQLIRDYTRN